MSSSVDWIFLTITLGCAIFLFQILFDYNRQASLIRPQLREAAEIHARHSAEIEKVERLIEEAHKEGSGLDVQITELDEKHQKLEKTLERLAAEKDEPEE